jgi:hypothetical protein
VEDVTCTSAAVHELLALSVMRTDSVGFGDPEDAVKITK